MATSRQKLLGQYFTPPEVVSALMGWLIRKPTDKWLVGIGLFNQCLVK